MRDKGPSPESTYYRTLQLTYKISGTKVGQLQMHQEKLALNKMFGYKSDYAPWKNKYVWQLIVTTIIGAYSTDGFSKETLSWVLKNILRI